MVNKYYRNKEKPTTPYTYLVRNKTTGLKYYGVRYCNGADPKGFWVDYFTSSSMIHTLIEVYGIDDFEFEIRKLFNTKIKALRHEQTVLRRLKLNLREDFLNKDITQDATRLVSKGKCISIYNEDTLKVVRWPIIKEIPEGWLKGNPSARNNGITKGRLWCHNPNTLESKMVKFEQDIPLGWIKNRPKQHSNSEALKRKKLVWVTNGEVSKQTDIKDIPEGWKRGRTKSATELATNKEANSKRRGNIHITNGLITKEILPTESIPEGWKRGRHGASKTQRGS